MKVNIKVYDKCKYEKDSKVINALDFNDIISYEVREVPKDEILEEADESCVDDYNEYLILTFENGETSTFRNSYADLFRLESR